MGAIRVLDREKRAVPGKSSWGGLSVRGAGRAEREPGNLLVLC